jgi:hypothetical protein
MLDSLWGAGGQPGAESPRPLVATNSYCDISVIQMLPVISP